MGLTDLDGSQSHVQDVQAGYMNDLIDIGVTGKGPFIKDVIDQGGGGFPKR